MDPDWVASGSRRRLWQIAAVTFGFLALELALIRWASSQVRVLAYFNNLILIACFLGLGTGLALGRKCGGLVHAVLPALLVLALPLAFSDGLGLMHLRLPDPTVYLWGAERSGAGPGEFLGAVSMVVAIFAAIAGVFTCAGGALGHLFARSTDLPATSAYAADLLGSLLGVLVFTLATTFGASPTVWFVLGGLPFILLSRNLVSALALAGVLVCAHSSIAGAIFSPYNRLDLLATDNGLVLQANRDNHQFMHDLSDAALTQEAGRGQVAHPTKSEYRRVYDLPFALGRSRQGRALVVGAGTGNDVQAALRNGFASVCSVEIDPKILAIGRQYHPEHPHADPRVTIVNDDARAFFRTYSGPLFDVVCFGFVDSHAMFSALSTLRLDNFLYTEQGLRAAWHHVAPGGVLSVSLSFSAGDWLARRLFWTMERATGRTPIVVQHGLHYGGTMMVAVDQAQLAKQLQGVGFPLFSYSDKTRPSTITTSDDWPFLYVRPGTVPWAYLAVITAVLALATVVTGAVFGGRTLRQGFEPVLFFLGAAFLLVETRGITSFSLLFGSTWVVNSAVIAGILVMALVANTWVAIRPPKNLTMPFTLLLISVLFLWWLDVDTLNRLPLLPRAALAGIFTGLPICFSGVIISSLLARTKDLSAALASNLIGSVLGGCLEYLSMAVGLRALALLALVLYLGALYFWLGGVRRAAAAG
jgi:spermidine synthase